jgi:uncharacterized membrane protein
MSVLRLLPWALWVALVGFSVATFESLPPEIPRHLNSAGAITTSVPRTWWSWMLLPFFALATQWLMFGLSHHLPKNPSLFNFPEKEKFLKLPPAYRGDVIPRMQETMDIIAVFVMLIFCFVQWVMYRAAHGHPTNNVSMFLMVATIAMVPGILVLTTRVNSAVDAADKKWKAAGSPTA